MDQVEALSSSLGDRVSKASLSRLENGRSSPSVADLGTLALVYDLPLQQLVELYEIERKLDQLPEPEVTAARHKQLLREIKGLQEAGRYLDVLNLARHALAHPLTEPEGKGAASTARMARQLRLVCINCMVHLGFFESAKLDSERVLNDRNLSIAERLAAWQLFVGSSFQLERFEIALAGLERAEALAQSPNAPRRMRADMAVLRGDIFVKLSRARDALEPYRDALETYEELPNRFEACRCRVLIGNALMELGKKKKAEETLRDALAVAERHGYSRLKSLGLSNLCKLFYRTGRSDEAEHLAIQSNRIARELDYTAVYFRNHWYLWKIASDRGDHSAARTYERVLALHLAKVPGSLPEARAFRDTLFERTEGGTA